MNPPKRDWDTRAWLIGILGGIVGGNLAAWSTYPPMERCVNKAFHASLFGSHSAGVISAILFLVTIGILPGLVSGLARRWTFVWGLLPLTLFLMAVDSEDWIESGIKDVVSSFWVSLLVVGICWVISSGPVSLIRWRRVCSKRRQEALLASYQAMREAASVPQEGVWPPPPKYNML